MPAAARGSGADTVFSKTGTGKNCRRPVTTATDQCSPDVIANNIGIVRQGDRVAAHNADGCGPDTSTLSTFSNTVIINGKNAGRIGDKYTDDNVITSGSTTVFFD